MRKIYSVLSIILIIGPLFLNAQGIGKAPNDKKKGGTVLLEASPKFESTPALNALGCDTLLYNPNNPTLYGSALYTWGAGNGYVNGTNKYEDKQFGNYFDVSGSANSNYVTGIRFVLGKANGADLTKKVYFRVYNLGSSITLAGSSPAFTIGDLKPFVGGGYIDYKFPTAIAIPDKEFFVTLDVSELSWVAGDSVALVSSNLTAVNVPDSAIVQDKDGGWFYTSTTGLPAGMFVYLFPYVSNNTTCTLPVSLSGLSAQQLNGSNKLTWSTKTEIGNKGFEIERSSDGSLFTKLDFVASKAPFGNSTKGIDYEFIDNSPNTSANYYRIKQIDQNGKLAFSNVALINRSLEKLKGIITFYPNPVKSSLNLQLASSMAGNDLVTVTNMSGMVVLQQAVHTTGSLQNISVNVSRLPKGTYIVRLNGEAKSAKFVKE